MAARRQDLTAKARIRNTALELFARLSVAGTPMRRIAVDAEVTVGLIRAPFRYGKFAWREVELYVVEQFAEAIASVPTDSEASDSGQRHDRAAAKVLAA